MSTMYEALRKAEAERRKNSPQSAIDQATILAERATPVMASVRPAQSMEIGMPLVVGLALVLAAILAIDLLWWKPWTKFATTRKVTTHNMAPVQGTLPVVKSNAVYPPGTYTLSGVIYAGQSSMAAVNGKLMRPGGRIDQYILKKIMPDWVELLNTEDNSVKILRMNL